MRTSYLHQKVSTLLVATSCLVASTVFGALPDISINFVGCCNEGNVGIGIPPAPTSLLPTDIAGVVPRGNWNNLSGNNVHNAALTDSNGAPTTVTIFYDADEQWGNNTAGTNTPDAKLLNGYLGISNDGHYRPLFLNNVPGGAYKLIMYTGRGDAQPQGFTVNPASKNTSLHIFPESAYGGTWIRATSTNPDARDTGNYVQFDEVAPVNGTITIDCRSEAFRGMMNGIQLIPLPVGAFRFVNQPADVNVDEGGSASFHGDAVDGNGAVTYMWLTNGVVDTANTTTTYTRPVLNLNENNRTFALVATDSSSSVTSRVATLTVNSVTKLVSAASNGRTNKVFASFGAAITLSGTYTLNNGATVFSVAYGATHKDVVLSTSILVDNATYTLSVLGETREDNGDPTVPNPNTITFVNGYGQFCSDFTTLPPGAALFNNAVTGTGYLGDDGSAANNVVHLTDDGGGSGGYGKLYISNAVLGATVKVLDAHWRVRIGGDLSGHADGMTFSWANGLATDGNFVAVEEGEGNGVSFVIDTWDGGSGPDTGLDIKWQGAQLPGSFLHIPRTSEGNTNFLCQDAFVSASASIDSAGLAKFTYNGNTVSAVIPGWTGIPNGAFVFAARGGGEWDNFWVDDVCINNFVLGPVFFTLQPVETTVLEGQSATFTAAVDGSPSYYYQWYTNGVPIAGATGPSYTTPPATEAYQGLLYSVQASNEFSSVTSSNAVLHVNVSPRVVSVGSVGDNKVRIVYTRNVELGPDFGPPYYDFLTGPSAFEASRAYGANHKEVILTTDAPLVINSTYILTITDVTEEGNPGSVLLPNPTEVAFHHGYGSVCADFAVGLPAGAAVNGTAAVGGGFVHLTDAVNSQQGNLFVPDPNGGYPMDRLAVSFKMLIGGGTCCGARYADGVSFNVASDITPSSSYGEEGLGSGLTLTFDTWDNAAPDTAPSIEVRYKGTVVAVQSMAGIREADRAPATPFLNDTNGNPLSLDTSNQFVSVKLIVGPDGKLDLSFKDRIIFQHLQLPNYTPFVGANFGFGARTGGANENAWIDDLCINNFSLTPPVNLSGPNDLTVNVNDPATFSVAVGDGIPPFSYQWLRNGAPIVGANESSYSFTAAVGDNGALYSAIVGNSYGSVTSQVARLTVILAPVVRNFFSSPCDGSGILVAYNKDVMLDGTYTVVCSNTIPQVGVAFYAEDFNAGNGGFTVQTPAAYDGPWVYDAGSGSWTQAGQGPESGHPNTSMLISPAFNVPQAGVVALNFAHRYSFEQDAGTVGWDGGQVRVSVNGGPFTAVPAGAFTQNGYSGTVRASSTSDLHGQAAFVANSANFAGGPGSTISTCTLGTFQAGDSIRVAFMAASDGNTQGDFQPNWQIDSLRLTVANSALSPITVTGVTYGESNSLVRVAVSPELVPATRVYYVTVRDVHDTAGVVVNPNPTLGTLVHAADGGPQLNCSSNRVVECTGGLTPVTYTVTANDLCDGPVPVICVPPSGTGFRIGTSNVVCTATDRATNVASCSLTVTVVDTTPPQVTCSSNILTAPTSPAGAVVTYIASASDPCGIASFNCSPPSGSTFPIGLTTVVCTAIDGSTNSASCSFTVTVAQPNTPPSFACGTNVIGLEDSGPVSIPGWVANILPYPAHPPLVYGSDFTSLPAGASVAGNAAISGGVLHLTDALNSQSGQFFTPVVSGGAVESFTLDFKLLIGGGTCCGAPIPEGTSRMADGLTVNFGNDLGAGFGEEGTGTGLIVSFDVWDNGGLDDAATAPDIDIRRVGAPSTIVGYQAMDGDREGGRAPSGPFISDPATGLPMKLITGATYAPVHIKLDADGTMDVDYKGVRVLDNVQTGYHPIAGARFGFGARTGGANANQWIDDLHIEAVLVDGASVETNQTVSFIVTTDHPEFFSVQPAVSPAGTLTYTPASNSCGAATITVVARDNGGTAFGGRDTSDPCTNTITITCVNVCPASSNLVVALDMGSSVNFQLPASDPDGDALTYIITQPPAHGTLTVNTASGAASYTPAAGYCGPDTLKFKVNDGQCDSGEATVTIDVRCTARGLKRAVLAELIVARATATSATDRDRLDKAIAALTAALESSLWLDASHVVPKLGQAVFQNEKDCVNFLNDLIGDARSRIPAATLQSWIDRQVQADRMLAVLSVDEAAAAGGNPRKIEQDRDQIARGDADAAAGREENAIEHYRNAWSHAVQLQVHGSVQSANGQVKLRFQAFPGVRYVIMGSTDMVTWQTVAEVTASPAGLIEFNDPAAHPQRFYRVVEP